MSRITKHERAAMMRSIDLSRKSADEIRARFEKDRAEAGRLMKQIRMAEEYQRDQIAEHAGMQIPGNR